MTFASALRYLLVLCLVQAPAFAYSFAAIAYSPSTGAYGYSYDCDSQSQAENLALSECSGSDARVVVWVEDGWAALVRNSDGAWSAGWSCNSLDEAISYARSGAPGGTLVCWVFSGD